LWCGANVYGKKKVVKKKQLKGLTEKVFIVVRAEFDYKAGWANEGELKKKKRQDSKDIKEETKGHALFMYRMLYSESSNHGQSHRRMKRDRHG
jgi:hypothetical protein